MITKEDLAGKGEASQKSRLAATEKNSHQTSQKASSDEQPHRKVPRLGSKTRTLLDALRNAGGRELSLPDLMTKTRLAAVHSGIATLREYGWPITNRMEHHPFHGGTEVHSFYLLIEGGEL